MDRIAGRNQVKEAMRAGRKIDRLYIALGSDAADVLQLAMETGVAVKEVDRQYLDSLVKEKHQGVVALAEEIRYWEVDDILGVAEKKHEAPLIVAVSNLEDPQNLGSILRSVDGAGAHGVIVPERRSVGLTTAVGRASAGAIEHVKVARVTNLARTIDEIKRQNIWVIGLDGSATDNIWSLDMTGPTLLVVGGEGKGLGRLVSEKCDMLAKIVMRGRVGSLNAGVATALTLYEARRQRMRLIPEE